MLDFSEVEKFEKIIAEFFGAPYCVAVDCCTHAIELCLRLNKPKKQIDIPKNTYVSVPFTLIKLGLDWKWRNEEWVNFYYIGNTKIIDAAVLWKPNSYIKNTFMCLSFQQKKHLSLGRGGAILLQNKNDYIELKKMSYDGRDLSKPWALQNIKNVGFHYYMTPETANLGIKKFNIVKNKSSKTWSFLDYPDLSEMKAFKNK